MELNNIISVAENAHEIMAAQNVYCPVCNERQCAPFGKLYVRAYGKCVDCSSAEDLEQNGENIFAIIEAT